MTTESVAKILGVSEKEVRKLACDGRIPAAKINGQWYIDSGDFDKWQKMRQWKEKVQAVQRIDLDAVVEKLLPFEDVDEHRIWPIGVYEIGNPGPMDWEAELTPVVRDAKSRSLFSYYAGTRAQAVEACRNDLRLRLAAIDELRGEK